MRGFTVYLIGWTSLSCFETGCLYFVIFPILFAHCYIVGGTQYRISISSYLLGSKADHDGPQSACSVRGPQSAFLRNPARVFISKNENVTGQPRKFVKKILKKLC